MTRRLLVAYSKASTFVQTTRDYLLMLKEHLGYATDYVHVTHGAKLGVDLDDYDIVFNNYCCRHCFTGYVSESFTEKLKAYRGLKVMAVQDEYDRTDTLKAAIRDLGFHIVLTCVPQSSLEYVYPQAELPGVTFLAVFTGYVPTTLIERSQIVKPLATRPIRVGYRGRDIGGRYGRLGFDKFEIGRRMKLECAKRGIPDDIAMDEKSRIYGPAWFDYVENCQSMLGSESGSNVFDFDGQIEKNYNRLKSSNGGRAPSYDEFAPFVSERESQIEMGQISPRVFECAALRTPMVLFRGRYSDALAPEEHYIVLEKDFSNVDRVFEKLNDLAGLEAMADRAYDHLIGSGLNTYAALCIRLRSEFENRICELEREGQYAAIADRRQRMTQGLIDVQLPKRSWLGGVETVSPLPLSLLPAAPVAPPPPSSPASASSPAPSPSAPPRSARSQAPPVLNLERMIGFSRLRAVWHLLPPGLRYRTANVIIRMLARFRT